MKTIKIGLFGFGVVGEGIYQVIKEKPNIGVEIKKIVIKDPQKGRNAPNELFSTNANDILKDKEIDLVVELINDDVAALSIIKQAFKEGKSVISANKKTIAEHHIDLIKLSQEHKVSFLYEAAVCGSVPIIRNLEEYFDNDLLTSVKGIVNGSTNYILSKMAKESLSFRTVLEDAQEKGFAEKDPILDVEGFDAANKLSIISTHAFGKQVNVEKIIRKGINAIHPKDIQYAKEKGLVIKLIAKTKGIKDEAISSLIVCPTFVDRNSEFAQTNNEYNGIIISSTLADEQFFYGKGAGRYPTSSAVLSDISAFKFGYKYEYKKGIQEHSPNNLGNGKFYISYQKNTNIDKGIFTEVNELFESTERNYIIGKVSYKRLVDSDILSNPEISLISYN